MALLIYDLLWVLVLIAIFAVFAWIWMNKHTGVPEKGTWRYYKTVRRLEKGYVPKDHRYEWYMRIKNDPDVPDIAKRRLRQACHDDEPDYMASVERREHNLAMKTPDALRDKDYADATFTRFDNMPDLPPGPGWIIKKSEAVPDRHLAAPQLDTVGYPV